MDIKNLHYNFLSTSLKDHTLHIQLNRPPVNALNGEFIFELHNAAKKAAASKKVRLVVVSSSAKVFCAGADLKERSSMPVKEVRKTVQKIQQMVRAWIAIPQPVIMLLKGTALGGGMEFALAGDIIIASDNAVVGFPEVSLGIIPAAGGTQLLQLRTNTAVAKKWILTGKKYSGVEALQDGVVDYCFSNEDFDEQSGAIIALLSGNAPMALRQAKKAINAQSLRLLHDGFKKETDAYGALIRSDDRTEALRAFLEKRSPVWRGK